MIIAKIALWVLCGWVLVETIRWLISLPPVDR